VREIIFRGKRIDTGEWVYGGFHKHQKYTPSPIIPKGEEPKEPECACLVIESGFSDWNMPKPILGHEVDPATVGQFAGEIQGQQVYEGDVIEFIDSFYGDFDKRTEKTVRGYVVWENHYAHNFLCFMIHVPQKTPFRVLRNITPWNRRKEVRTYLRTHHCALKDNSKFQVIGNLHDNPELLEQSSC